MSTHTFESPNGDGKPGESRSYYLDDDRLVRFLETVVIRGKSLGEVMLSSSGLVTDPRIHEVPSPDAK